MRRMSLAAVTAATVAISGALFTAPASAAGASAHVYQVTIKNLASGQPLSPGLVATTSSTSAARVFTPLGYASPELAALAQDGNEAPLVGVFKASPGTTDVVDIARPTTPKGSTAGGFSDTTTVTIKAKATDRLSLGLMLICTNDGFVGLPRIPLPTGSMTLPLTAWDAGVEKNTERSADLPDPCSGVGPAPLTGDPNGNEDVATAENPKQRILPHFGVNGTIGDLTAAHRWSEPVAKVTITRLS